jgi:hypothetical protein
MQRYGRGERIMLPLATDGVTGDGLLGATVYQVPHRPTCESGLKIIPKYETVEYFPLR